MIKDRLVISDPSKVPDLDRFAKKQVLSAPFLAQQSSTGSGIIITIGTGCQCGEKGSGRTAYMTGW